MVFVDCRFLILNCEICLCNFEGNEKVILVFVLFGLNCKVVCVRVWLMLLGFLFLIVICFFKIGDVKDCRIVVVRMFLLNLIE